MIHITQADTHFAGVGLNGTDFNLNLSQDSIHIRQCSAKDFTAEPKFCCGFQDESSQCCTVPGAFFELPNTTEPAIPALGPQIDPAVATPSSPGDPADAAATPSTAGLASGDGSTPPTDPPLPVSSAPNTPASTTDGYNTTPSADDKYSTAPTPRPSSQIPPAIAGATSRPAGAQVTDEQDKKDAQDAQTAGVKVEEGSTATKTERFNMGAVVGIGLGASIAGAGMVTIGIYFFVWRRLYMRQRQRYMEHMQSSRMENTRYPPPPPPPLSGPPRSALPPTHVAMVGPDGKPAMLMKTMRPKQALQRQGTWDSDSGTNQSIPLMPPPYTLQTAGISAVRYADSVTGASPVSLYLKDMGWEVSSSPASDRSEEERWAPDIKAKPKQESADASARGRTVTWLGGRSIYEMP